MKRNSTAQHGIRSDILNWCFLFGRVILNNNLKLRQNIFLNTKLALPRGKNTALYLVRALLGLINSADRGSI